MVRAFVSALGHLLNHVVELVVSEVFRVRLLTLVVQGFGIERPFQVQMLVQLVKVFGSALMGDDKVRHEARLRSLQHLVHNSAKAVILDL